MKPTNARPCSTCSTSLDSRSSLNCLIHTYRWIAWNRYIKSVNITRGFLFLTRFFLGFLDSLLSLWAVSCTVTTIAIILVVCRSTTHLLLSSTTDRRSNTNERCYFSRCLFHKWSLGGETGLRKCVKEYNVTTRSSIGANSTKDCNAKTTSSLWWMVLWVSTVKGRAWMGRDVGQCIRKTATSKVPNLLVMTSHLHYINLLCTSRWVPRYRVTAPPARLGQSLDKRFLTLAIVLRKSYISHIHD